MTHAITQYLTFVLTDGDYQTGITLDPFNRFNGLHDLEEGQQLAITKQINGHTFCVGDSFRGRIRTGYESDDWTHGQVYTITHIVAGRNWGDVFFTYEDGHCNEGNLTSLAHGLNDRLIERAA